MNARWDQLLPDAALVLTVGAPGSGKSSLVADRFDPGQRFSLDLFRGLLTDGDQLDMGATTAAVDMMRAAITYRTTTRRTTVLDTTAASWTIRGGWRTHAVVAGVPVVAIRMHTPLAVCLARQTTERVPAYPGANSRPVKADVVERMWHEIDADPPTGEEFDLVLHAHPTARGILYAEIGRGHSPDWAGRLLRSDRWGADVYLLNPGEDVAPFLKEPDRD